jgi:anaerobic magnesium-protoporphyrin IX monomethyl ester cyclase
LILPFNAPQDLNDVAMQAMLFEPDLVGLSIGFQHRAREFLTLAQRLRDYDFEGHLTCGGHFPTFASSELLLDVPALDSVVLHEGEVTLIRRGTNRMQTKC